MNTLLRSGLSAVFASSVLFLTAGCAGMGVEGTGPYVRQPRTVSGFTRVRVALSGKLEVRQGANYTVEIEAEQNLQELIETEVDGKTLVIKARKNVNPSKELHYFITMPNVEGLEVAGSGNIEVLDIFSPKELDLDIGGSGNIKGKFIAGSIDADIAGSGNITVEGSAEEFKGSIAGSGNINALNLNTQSADLDIAGSGDIDIAVQKELEIDIAGSGSVKYKGDPAKVDQDVNGSGKVRKI